MRVKIKYLNYDNNPIKTSTWDKDNLSTENEIMNNIYRMTFAISGGYTGDENDYIDVNEYTIDADVDDVDDVYLMLESIYEEHTRINDGHFCRLKDDQRPMFIGDLIYLDDKAFTVEPIGFKIVEV